MANVTASAEDGAHGLFSVRTTDQDDFSYLWFDSLPFSSLFWAVFKYLSNFILSEICGTVPVD